MFEGHLDYHDWVCLKTEDRANIGTLENQWNDFDRFTTETKLLHTTRRKTQPWKSGLPIDWRPAERFRLFPPIGWLMRARRRLFGEYGLLGNYKSHPDQNQENLFFDPCPTAAKYVGRRDLVVGSHDDNVSAHRCSDAEEVSG